MATRKTYTVTGRMRTKLALIIGIGDYEELPKLENPSNDARALSKQLQSIGFIGCEPHLNMTREEMRHVLVAFEELIQPGDLVLFYFAGHGFQWEV